MLCKICEKEEATIRVQVVKNTMLLSYPAILMDNVSYGTVLFVDCLCNSCAARLADMLHTTIALRKGGEEK